ncbi:MAG: hypothetical protein MJE63_34350 [Proteobacteria bacterium]|nr:hypothetical protein [Pseudomonadota bacterium]
MSWHSQIWPNFLQYLKEFEPYKKHQEQFVRYFGNRKQPPTGFKNRSLSWYNPVSSRCKFNCGYRMVCNVYKSCDHGCSYCYVNGYSKGVIQGKRNPGFIKRLKKDLEDFTQIGMPKGPVHLSNSTDPLQARLEDEYGDTFETLKLLSEHRNHFSEIIMLTKNPGLLFDSTRDYLTILDNIKDILTIEISVAFYRDNFKQIEPGTPPPQDRLKYLQQLVALGCNVRLRLDPIFPAGNSLQSHEDIISILDQATGIECVISKPLRLVKPKKGQPDHFYDLMSNFYQGGKKKGVEWHGGRYVFSPARAKHEMEFLSTQCRQRGIPLVHCKETVLVDQAAVPLIKKALTRN